MYLHTYNFALAAWDWDGDSDSYSDSGIARGSDSRKWRRRRSCAIYSFMDATALAKSKLSGARWDWIGMGQSGSRIVVSERTAWLIWRIAVMRHIWKYARETQKVSIKTNDLGNELVFNLL